MPIMHTTAIDIKDHGRYGTVYGRIAELSRRSKALYNHAQFYIRNVQTGMRKSPEERTANETEVLHYVFTGLQKANITKENNFLKKLRKQIRYHWKMAALLKQREPFKYPSSECPYLDYNRLDAIFKENDDPLYYDLPSQSNQQVLKKAFKAWKSYFESLASYKKDPSKFRGRPKRPGYKKVVYYNIYLTNQICKYHCSGGKGLVLIPGTDTYICVGKECYDKYVKTEIRPVHGHFRLLITFSKKGEAIKAPKRPKRILGIDAGLDNFMSCTPNTGHSPFIYDGAYLKSMNAYYNKRMAKLRSALTEGMDHPCYTVTKRMMSISDKREACIRDYFYKVAHHICRICKEERIQVIVYGHNENWKQEINIGHVNDQNFVCIPYARFFQILETIATKYHIAVVKTEESYTSRASLIDGDPIPVYKKGDEHIYSFSGTRIKRGLYKTGDICINADINAAGNIIRKVYPHAFDGFDFSALITAVERFSAEDILNKLSYKQRSAYKRKRSAQRTEDHNARAQKKKVYINLFRKKKDTQLKLSA